MTLLYYDPKFLEHQTGRHPERAERLQQVVRHLERTELDRACTRVPWQPATIARLARVHDPHYVEQVRQYALQGGGRIESDTVVSPASYDVAMLAAGAACDAVERVLRGEDRQALVLSRPPGHHALLDAPMGFCLFNNIAVAARVATHEFELDRVLVVDWDVHHGNGTQDAFWRDPQIAFMSIHRFPFYPGSGAHDETGSGPGLGRILNLPVAMGTARDRYLSQFSRELERFADKIKPQLILLSAGFDAHREDPVGSLGLETEDFIYLTDAVLDAAAAHCEGKVVSLLEGGYNPSRLAGSVEVHLRELLDRHT